MEEKWENKRIKERNISIWNENILQYGSNHQKNCSSQ